MSQGKKKSIVKSDRDFTRFPMAAIQGLYKTLSTRSDYNSQILSSFVAFIHCSKGIANTSTFIHILTYTYQQLT